MKKFINDFVILPINTDNDVFLSVSPERVEYI